MKIAVCEDSKQERETLAASLAEVIKIKRLTAEIVTFSNGVEMLEAMKEECFPVSFLDIYMNGINGIELAQEIIKHDPNAAIVFTTSSPDFMAEGFAIGVAHYLLKPFTTTDVKVALDRCLRLTGKQEKYVELSIGRKTKKVLFSQIIFIESKSRCCMVYTAKEELRVYMKLNLLQKELDDPRFLRSHRSFLVNLDYVNSVTVSDFVLYDGRLIPIRREDRAAMKDAFEDYYFEKSRHEGI